MADAHHTAELVHRAHGLKGGVGLGAALARQQGRLAAVAAARVRHVLVRQGAAVATARFLFRNGGFRNIRI